MYLIIADSFKFDDKNKNYFLCSKDYYNNVIKIFPEIKTLEFDEIEGLLLYSIKNDHAEQKTMAVECESFAIDDSLIKIDYGQLAELTASCKTIKRNLYGLLKRKGKLPDGALTPFVALADINDFYKLQGIENPKIKGKINEIEDLKKQHKWLEIINYFGDINQIEKLECWNNLPYLNEIIFALSKITEPGYKNISSNKKSKYEQIFFKTIKQSLSNEPNNQVIKSILAYHYYCVFISEKKNDRGYYEKANELYLWLIEHSTDKFKENYRYWKLQEQHFDLIKWNLDSSNWIKKVNEILTGFQNLIQDYSNLTAEKQKRFQKEYIKCLYNYSTFAIENLLQVWDCYVNNLIFNQPIPDYLSSQEKLQMVTDIDKNLATIRSLQEFEKLNPKVSLTNKPSYLDILYRQAQITQIKGIIYTIKQAPKQDCDKFFVQSNVYINQLFNIVYTNKNKIKFSFPHHAKAPKAINDYFLNSQELNQNFYHAKPYLLYQQAIIYVLQNKKEKALQVLSTIPQNDKCFNKSEKLRKRILNGN